MSAHWAVPGAKCVCINPDAWVDSAGNAFENTFKPDQVLTVVYVRIGEDLGRPVIAVWGTPLEEWYDAEEFRPIVPTTQEQDVQMILSLLTPTEVSA